DHKLPHQKIEVKKQYQVLPPVNCYPEQLNWVFINLINNAIEALETTSEITSEITSATTSATTANQRRPRQITITTAMRPQGYAPALAQQPTIVIQVADTGPGVAPGIQSQLFQPFTTTKSAAGQQGLGLAMGAAIVEDHHGGVLRHVPESGPGALFEVEIPLRQG
ncbi:sensor histidine kinase, partial [Prochlorothrix hollandica]|uniref:sensor histidine kinase n=1 Tax=Prochlorothrix hollandica TaxID=1223 RepID=UPI0033428854